ncbi:hypothetical protein PHLCEN_2v12934 [Hermanssonia centrifuga]|uniref:Uncharacterized protein n=1 Tax=Hermanssonia centrifuga TaxID=98765 RepID=A0A2R6NGV3_9APHY|nr:hypothetical protein PHLCEN_2v12934 [Hermanssonia centrifuga]
MQIPVILACSIQYDPSLSQPVTSLFRQPVTIRLVKPSTVVALVKNMVDTVTICSKRTRETWNTESH